MTVPFGSNCEDLESSFAWGQTNRVSWMGTSVYISKSRSGSESSLLFPPKIKNCISPTEAETPKISSGPERRRAGQSRPDQTGTERSRAELSSWREGPGPRASLQQCCFTAMLLHSWVVTLLSCYTDIMFSQLCCITTELFAMNKISFFTACQIGDSCWG